MSELPIDIETFRIKSSSQVAVAQSMRIRATTGPGKAGARQNGHGSLANTIAICEQLCNNTIWVGA